MPNLNNEPQYKEGHELEFVCPDCEGTFTINGEEFAGKANKIICPLCANMFTVSNDSNPYKHP